MGVWHFNVPPVRLHFVDGAIVHLILPKQLTSTCMIVKPTSQMEVAIMQQVSIFDKVKHFTEGIRCGSF
jgi:hypothetical protein